MKKLITLLAVHIATFTLSISITSCKGSDNGEPDINKPVVVDDKNKASDGSSIISIDDYNFYKDYVKYTVEAGHLIVSGYDNAGFKGAAQIASQITYKGNSYEVLGIGDKAFYECTSLTSITLPKGITSIGDFAFNGCSSLTSLNIPEDLKNIGKNAFSGCSSLASDIRIPEGVKKIEEFTFAGCKAIKSITLPTGLESIYSYSFRNCSSLVSINIPDNVESIGNNAFEGCTGLTSITIGRSIKYIGEDAFSNCI